MRYTELTEARRDFQNSPLMRHAYCYHGTPLAKIEGIAERGLCSNFRPKYSLNWSDGKPLTKREAREYNLLYFTFEPVDWGVQHRMGPTKILRFHLSLLARVGAKWQEDDARAQDEYYAISRNPFCISPQYLEIEYAPPGERLRWMPLLDYYRDYYFDDPDLDDAIRAAP